MKRRCPRCGGKLVRVVYGYPTAELGEEARRGEIILGGCMPNPDVQHACVDCGANAARDPQHW